VDHLPEEHAKTAKFTPAGFEPDNIDPVAVSHWFGARYAALKVPDSYRQYVAQRFSDTAAGRGHSTTSDPGVPQPVYLTFRYHIDGDQVIDVATRRRYGTDFDHTLIQHMWWTLLEHRHESASMAEPPREGPTELPELFSRINFADPPPADGSGVLTLDGHPVRWSQIVDEDQAVCGGEVGKLFVAVLAPTKIMDQISIEMRPR
jgi:hypothetical protein